MDLKHNNELVSVILPVYDSECFLEKTINSILNQTYENIEIIIINDKSKDNSIDIIKKYSKKNKKIRYFENEKNLGVAFSRNLGIDVSTGRYIAFIDSDDLWYKNKLEKQISFMVENGVGFSYTAIEIIDSKDFVVKKHRNVVTRIDYEYLLKNTAIATSTVVIDRYKIENFRMPDLRSGQDYATWLSILRKGILAYGINECLVKYRKRENSLSSNKFKSIKQVIYIQNKLENIKLPMALYNALFFIINAAKKHLL